MKPRYIDAVWDLVGDKCTGGPVIGPVSELSFTEGAILPTENEIQTRLTSMLSDFDALEYARNRQPEYPSIADLVVALYDTDDKSAIEAKRAAVKAKYSKP